MDGGVTIRDALVFVHLSRGESPGWENFLAGVLIWLPAITAGVAFSFLFLFHPQLDERILVLAAAAVAVSLVLVFQYTPVAIITAVAGIGGAVWLYKRKKEEPGRPIVRKGEFHILIVTALLSAALTLSWTTHILFDKYNGLAVFPDSSIPDIRTQLRQAGGESFDPVVAQMRHVTAFSSHEIPTNAWAAFFYLIFAVIYVIYFVLYLNPLKRPGPELYAPPPWATITFAIAFYVAVGVGFGIRYHNTYLIAVTKHNAVVKYAGYLMETSFNDVASGPATKNLSAPDRCVQIFEEPRPATNGLDTVLKAACRRYWPAAVIGQERPDIETGQNELNASVSFYDLLYFSFVSFTTTGYGDIRPLSDEVRRWVILENIVEILFTAMFFVTAVEHAKPVEHAK